MRSTIVTGDQWRSCACIELLDTPTNSKLPHQ